MPDNQPDVGVDSFAARRSPLNLLFRYMLVPFLALPGVPLGVAVFLLPGLWVDGRTFGPNNDDSGTVLVLALYVGGFLGWVWGCLAVGSRFVPRLDDKPSRRSAPRDLASLWAPLAVVVYLMTFGSAVRSGSPYLALVATGGVVVAGLTAIKFYVKRSPVPSLVALALGFAVVVGSVVAGRVSTPNYHVSLYEGSGTALGLVNEDRLASELPGWWISRYERRTNYNREGHVYVVDPNGLEVRVDMLPRSRVCPQSDDDCSWLEPLDDGSRVTAKYSVCDDGDRIKWVSAQKGDSSWVASPEEGSCPEDASPLTADDLRLLLTTLDPTTAEIWVDTVPSR